MKWQDYRSVRNPTEIPDNAVYLRATAREESSSSVNENTGGASQVAEQKMQKLKGEPTGTREKKLISGGVINAGV